MKVSVYSSVSQPWYLEGGWTSIPRFPKSAWLAGEFWGLKSIHLPVPKVGKHRSNVINFDFHYLGTDGAQVEIPLLLKNNFEFAVSQN